MSSISRREFLTGLTATAGALTLTNPQSLAGEKPGRIKKGTDLATLGKSGLQPTVLGLGTGTVSGSQQRDLGMEGFKKLVRHALERGLRYIDTADSYGTHPFVRNALEGVPRERYFIQTKTLARDPKKAKEDIDRFLKELNTDYVDTLLMHAMMKSSWPNDMRPVQDVLRAAQQQGKIKALGISCHGWEPLAASVDAAGIDVQLVRINPFGAKMDGPPQDVAPLLKKMHDQGRGIIGMKIFGEDGFKNRDKRFQSLKYVLGLGCVDCFTIGFTSIAQLEETLEMIEKVLAAEPQPK